MLNKPSPVVRFNHRLEALQVQSDNLELAASWCNGEVVTKFGNLRAVKVHNSFAYNSDWIVKVGPVYLVYSDFTFNQNFQRLS